MGAIRTGRRLTFGVALLLGGAALALYSEFLLDDWASVSQLGDWIQHGVIFWGAVGFGASLVVLHRPGDGVRSTTEPTAAGMEAHRPRAGWSVTLGLSLLLGGASVALFSQFFLDDWASKSAGWDGVQHGAIFLGGVGIGVALVTLRRVSHRDGADALAEPAASPGWSRLHAGRWLVAGLLSLLAAGYLTALPYLDLQGGLSIPLPISRIDVVHIAAGVGVVVFVVCLAFRLLRHRPGWSRWMTGLLAAAAVLYGGVVVTGVILLFPLPADLADELTHAHLIAGVWGAEPALALLFELGRRGELRGPRIAAQSVGTVRRPRPRSVKPGVIGAGLVGLAALVPAILMAVVAPRALSPAAQRGGYRSWQPIGPGVIMDVATLQPGGQSVVAGGLGLYEVNLDGASRPLGDFAGQDVLSVLRTDAGTVYVGTGLGLYRAPSFAGPYRRLPLPAGGVHGIAVRGSEIWASATFRGFYVSLDGGSHWRLVNAGLEYPDLAWALINDHGTIYGSDVDGVYRFAGNGWHRVSSEQGVYTFTQAPNGRLFAAAEGGGVWSRDPNGQWVPSDSGLLSHNEGSFQGIHEFGVNFAGGGYAYGGSMLAGGDVSLDGGRTWSQQWPNLTRVGAVYRILPDGGDLIAATDAGLLLYRLPNTAPAGPGWWALLIGGTLAACLLAAATLVSRIRGKIRFKPEGGAASTSPSD
jgi:hypothetical protein